MSAIIFYLNTLFEVVLLLGEVAERLKALVSKTSMRGNRIAGSNPALSASRANPVYIV